MGSEKTTADGLIGAISRLTPEERTELGKIMNTYIESKGITIISPPATSIDSWSWGASNSSSKKNSGTNDGKVVLPKRTPAQIQIDRAAVKAKVKALSTNNEERKEYVGHVTLMK
jgi:endo-beta-N-acetylglucosaminidase D